MCTILHQPILVYGNTTFLNIPLSAYLTELRVCADGVQVSPLGPEVHREVEGRRRSDQPGGELGRSREKELVHGLEGRDNSAGVPVEQTTQDKSIGLQAGSGGRKEEGEK